MYIEIIYDGEKLIVHEDSLAGYEPHEVVCRHEDMPCDDIYAMVSHEHLALVHLQKGIEAVLILSGYDLPASLLAEEAQATGQNLRDLAEKVQANRRAVRDYEVARRVAKTKSTSI